MQVEQGEIMPGKNRENRIDYDDRREQNKARARRMALVMGVACVLFVLAMIVEVYL